jgi:hypothetical protein
VLLSFSISLFIESFDILLMVVRPGTTTDGASCFFDQIMLLPASSDRALLVQSELPSDPFN